MIVDPSKVNLSEKDIEDWLWENPEEIRFFMGHKVNAWLGRQIGIPSGVLDLLGYTKFGDNHFALVVVEIKNTEFTQASILQVCRYAHDIDQMIDEIEIDERWQWGNGCECIKIVVAKGQPDDRIQREADAVNVILQSAQVSYSINVSGAWSFTSAVRKGFREQRESIAKSNVFYKLQNLGEIPKDKAQEIRDNPIPDGVD